MVQEPALKARFTSGQLLRIRLIVTPEALYENGLMGDNSFRHNAPDPLLPGKELFVKAKSTRPYMLLLACVLISGGPAHVLGANMRSFIESVRRKAAVVYVGSVKEVRSLQRTKFDIEAKAVVDIKAVMRTPGSNPQQATIEYSSYDDKTPMMEGGPQYQLRPGVLVLAFADSFDANIPPGYLAQGSRQELLQRVEALRDALAKMSPDQLKVHEITEDDRRVQMTLYEKLSAYLRTAK